MTDTGWVDNIPVPAVACTLTPVSAGTMGASIDAVSLAPTRLIGRRGALGYALQPLPDFDGDGRGELAVGDFGTPGFYGVGAVGGEAWYVAGSSLLPGVDLRHSDVHAVLLGEPDSFGDAAFLAWGHLLSGGRSALAIGSSALQPTYFVELPPLLGENPLGAASTASIEGGAATGSQIFRSYIAAGDVDGDGVDDLSGSGYGSDGCFGGGGVTVYRGPFDLKNASAVDLAWARYGTYALDERSVDSSAGCSGSFSRGIVWDMDGDGDAEVVVGGDEFLDIAPADGVEPWKHGGLAIFDGGVAGQSVAGDARAVVYGECSAVIGYELQPVGDVDADGRPDLAAGSSVFAFPGEAPRGAVFLLTELHRARGHVPLSAVSCGSVYGDIGDQLYTATSLGDIDADGFDDLAVGATNALGGDGAVHVFLGPIEGPHTPSDADLVIRGEGGSFGYRLAGGEDLTGDGVLDLVVGAHAKEDGYVYVFSGAELLSSLP